MQKRKPKIKTKEFFWTTMTHTHTHTCLECFNRNIYGIEQLSQHISKQRGTWGKPALNMKEKQEQEQNQVVWMTLTPTCINIWRLSTAMCIGTQNSYCNILPLTSSAVGICEINWQRKLNKRFEILLSFCLLL